MSGRTGAVVTIERAQTATDHGVSMYKHARSPNRTDP
jgi:hypothetical protein